MSGRIKLYTVWEIWTVSDISNLTIFEASKGTSEPAVFLVSGLHFLMYFFFMETVLFIVVTFYSTIKRDCTSSILIRVKWLFWV